MRGQVLVVAKAPVPGRVKTRLCPPCSPSEAAELARACLEDTLAHAVGTRRATGVVLALDGEVGEWCPPGVKVVAQAGRGLGERLAQAWAEVRGPAIQVGMDTPQAGPGLLDHALGLLGRPGIDAVLGPAADGGWWALGLRRPHPHAFLGVPMSTPRTGAAQLAQLRRLGLRVHLLPELVDVDRIGDARLVASGTTGSRLAATLAAVDASIEDRAGQSSVNPAV